MLRLFVQVAVTTLLSVLIIYLYLIFITIYQENRPLADLAVVRAGPLRVTPLTATRSSIMSWSRVPAGFGCDATWPPPVRPAPPSVLV